MDAIEEKPRILYLEDDVQWQKKMKEYLAEKFDVTLVDNAEGALHLIARRGFALVVVDISLVLGDSGDEEGLKFIEFVRNKERFLRDEGNEFNSVKFMIFTAYPWRDRIRRAFRDLGVIDFLDKADISRVKFVEAVNRGFSTQYDIAAIRNLLRDAFFAKELWRFCQERSAFQRILAHFSQDSSLEDMIDQVIEYCRTQLLFPELLLEIKKYNPKQYARHQARLLRSDG